MARSVRRSRQVIADQGMPVGVAPRSGLVGSLAHPRDCGAHDSEHDRRALAAPDPRLSQVDLLVDDREHVDGPTWVDAFALMDGFADAHEMGRFFVKLHGPEPFHGFLIRW